MAGRIAVWGVCVLIGAACLLGSAPSAIAAPPPVEEFLQRGELAAAEDKLTRQLAEQHDDEAAFSLGIVQFLRGVERLCQSFHRHGLRTDLSRQGGAFANTPFLRLPLRVNPRPEPLDYQTYRQIFIRLLDDLAQAEKTLSRVNESDVKLPLRLGLIRLDLDGDGRADRQETLWRLFARINRMQVEEFDENPRLDDGLTEQEEAAIRPAAEVFAIAFDQGDVHWLRGYCRLLSAMGEVYLAYDTSEMFDRVGPYLFAGIKPTERTLNLRIERRGLDGLLDVIAIIHLIRFPLAEPERMRRAHEHLLAVVEQSRLSWKAIMAETDNDREWIPNPKQKSAMLGLRVSGEMVTGWHEFLDEAEAILQGETLIPTPVGAVLGADQRGIDLKRVFHEPREFDFVLWLQGTGYQHYLGRPEQRRTDPETWRRLEQMFGGQFLGFAVWFN